MVMTVHPANVHSVTFPVNEGSVKNGLNYIKTTKYTILTFIPLNLAFQFRRLYNIYFLIAAFTTVFGDSVLSPSTQVTPLVFVLAVGALKDGYEDYQRYRQDVKANNVKVRVIRSNNNNNTKLLTVLAKNLMPGDFIYYERGERFSVDAIALSTSNEDGSCYIDTAQLDGENNLKRRAVPAETARFSSQDTIIKLCGDIKCELPNQNLSTFEGRLEISESVELNEKDDKHVVPISISNFLPRGAVLRNTEHCWAVVTYTGSDTKIMQNLRKASLKTSTLHRKLNIFTFCTFIYNLLLLITEVVMELNQYSHEIETQERMGNETYMWYLNDGIITRNTFAEQLRYDVLSVFATYTYVIPISLFVTLEVARLAQGIFMHWDEKLVTTTVRNDGEVVRQKMRPNNTNLNEDLAMIHYIFSDKTGTLTQNEMVLAKYFIDGFVFDEMKNPGGITKSIRESILPNGHKPSPRTLEYMTLFQRALTIAHDVLPTSNAKGTVIFESASPDETALLNSAYKNDFKLISRSKKEILITTPVVTKPSDDSPLGFCDIEYTSEPQTEIYTPLQVLEFNSDRKRMSVIVKTPTGKIHLYCKGADNIILSRLDNKSLSTSKSTNSIELLHKAEVELEKFAGEGLRTLVVAFRELTQKEYEEFKLEYEEAQREIIDREEKVAKVAEKIEKNLIYLGSSAIEDRLQDQVPETIDYLLKCDIKIWLLTGDKQATAINIAYSSKLIDNTMRLHKISGNNSDDVKLSLKVMSKDINEFPNMKHALTITGDTLQHLFESCEKQDQLLFLRLGGLCCSVLCSRVTPLQKARVVNLVKENIKGCTTLSIGDGANDVSMIQSANIGVGIMGKEGTQAVRASDYAIGEFRLLRRLLGLHGRYSYMRITSTLLYSFYKNIAMISVLWIFGYFSLFSGQINYEEIFLVGYNMLFTLIPPLVMSIFDRDINDDLLEMYPQLYQQVRNGYFWNWVTVAGWLFCGAYHAAIVFGVIYFVDVDNVVSDNGKTTGYWVQTVFFGTPILATVILKFVLHTRTFFWLTGVAVFLSMLFNSVAVLVLEYFGYSEVGTGVISHISFPYYLVVVLVPITCNLPDFVTMYINSQFKPPDAQIIAEEQYLRKKTMSSTVELV